MSRRTVSESGCDSSYITVGRCCKKGTVSEWLSFTGGHNNQKVRCLRPYSLVRLLFRVSALAQQEAQLCVRERGLFVVVDYQCLRHQPWICISLRSARCVPVYIRCRMCGRFIVIMSLWRMSLCARYSFWTTSSHWRKSRHDSCCPVRPVVERSGAAGTPAQANGGSQFESCRPATLKGYFHNASVLSQADLR